jgi:hypothetical protein
MIKGAKPSSDQSMMTRPQKLKNPGQLFVQEAQA